MPLPTFKEQQLDQLLAIRELERRGHADIARAVQTSGNIPDDLEFAEFSAAARAAYGPASFYASGGRDILPYVYDYIKETSIEDMGEDLYNFGSAVAQDIKENPVRTAIDFIPYIGAVAGGGEGFVTAEQMRKAAERAKAAGDMGEYKKLRATASSIMMGSLAPAFGRRGPERSNIIQQSDRYKDVPPEQMTREMQVEAAMDTVDQALESDIEEFVPLAGAPKYTGPMNQAGRYVDQDRFAIMSGELSNLSPDENKRRTREIVRQAVTEFGPERVSLVKGVYGSPERSIIIEGIDPITARNIGDRFDQESVMTDRGLIYSRGSAPELYGQGIPIKPRLDSMGRPDYRAIIDPEAENFFTDMVTARGEPIRFRFDLNENEMFEVPAGPLTPSSATGVHFSRQSNLRQLDPLKYGTASAGEEKVRVAMGAPLRSYSYLPSGDVRAVVPEQVVTRANRYQSSLNNLYDLRSDPEKMSALSSSPTDLEQMVQARGYRGIISDQFNDPSMGREGSALTFYREPVTSIDTAASLGGLPPTVAPDYIQKSPKISQLGQDLNMDPRIFNAGSGTTGAGRARDIDRLRNLRVSYEDLRGTDSPTPIVRLQDMEGMPFVMSMSDRSMGKNRIRSINEVPVGQTTRGGMDHMTDPLNADVLWRSTPEAVTGSKSAIYDMAKSLAGDYGRDPLLLPVTMSPTGGDFSSQVGNPMLKYNRVALGESVLDELDKDIQNVFPNWKGIRNDQSLTDFYSGTGDQRKAVLNIMDKKYSPLGGLTIAEARMASTPSDLLSMPDGSIISAGVIDTSRAPELRPDYDVYGSTVFGESKGNFDTPYQMFELLPDIVESGNFDPMQPPRNQLRKIETGSRGGVITEDIIRAAEDRRRPPVSSETFSGRRLDMSPEARMQRAQDLGFDTDNVFYHGTSSDFAELQPSSVGDLGGGVYVTPNPEKASGYAAVRKFMKRQTNNAGPNVLPLRVKSNLNYLDLEGSSIMPFDEARIQSLKDQGYDGIRQFDADGNVIQMNIFDPKNIRSINAEFDPTKADSADLLSSVGPTSALRGVA